MWTNVIIILGILSGRVENGRNFMANSTCTPHALLTSGSLRHLGERSPAQGGGKQDFFSSVAEGVLGHGMSFELASNDS